MKKFNYFKNYEFSILLFLAVLFISKSLFQGYVIETSGKIKGAEISEKNLALNTDKPLDNKYIAIQSFISSIKKEPIQPTANPLYTVTGEYVDVNQDNKKEWVIRENWQGASGWSDSYKIYQLNNLKPKSIYDKNFENSIVYFDNGKIYQIEPYYQEDQPRSSVNQLLVHIWNWKDNNFLIESEEIFSMELL